MLLHLSHFFDEYLDIVPVSVVMPLLTLHSKGLVEEEVVMKMMQSLSFERSAIFVVVVEVEDFSH